MNIPRIVDAIGYIDDDLITAALEDPPRKRHNLMIKWMSVAACLALVMIAGILVPHFLRTATIAESKYKYHVSETERAIEWNGHGNTRLLLKSILLLNLMENSLLRKVRILFIQR